MATEIPAFDLRGLIENSLLEWEGNVAAVAVAGGCNFRCPYCHSWRYVTGLEDLRPIDIQALFTLLDRQKGWIDGVVLTGGEPTMQPGLEAIIRRVREYGVKVKLHSNGSRPAVLGRLLDGKLLDCLALDYKAPLDGRFFPVAGIAPGDGMLDAVRGSFALAAASRIEREYHTTLSPKYVDLASFGEMGEALEPGGLWILQQFENGDCLDSSLAGAARHTNDQLDAFEALAREKHEKVLLKRGKSALS